MARIETKRQIERKHYNPVDEISKICYGKVRFASGLFGSSRFGFLLNFGLGTKWFLNEIHF